MSLKNILLLIFLFPALSGAAFSAETEALLQRLDSVVTHATIWEGVKRHRINELYKKSLHARTVEEHYWSNKNLYDEYSVYDADSAMTYANRNFEIATRLGDGSRQAEWEINRSFLLSVTGLLKEAQDAIDRINYDSIPDDLKAQYFNQLAYLYSHYGQYSGDNSVSPVDYYVQSSAYQDSTYVHADIHDPMYLWYKAWAFFKKSQAQRDEVMNELKTVVDSASYDTRTDAMNAYALARLYEISGDLDNRVKYLALSAICDVRIANKDIASLEELSKIMLARGDIDRAYAYVTYCQQQAQNFHNRVRSFTLANAEKRIREEYSNRDNSQRLRMHIFMWILATLSLVLIIMILMFIRKNKRLGESQERLSRVNRELKESVDELSALKEHQEDANRRLKDMNTQLSEVNNALNESNFIKEEYVGQMFSICSDYINKIEAFRKDISRKLKTNQLDALHKTVDSPSMVQAELKEFYHSFDTIFLNLFPDFVNDFNKLLRPDEQIIPMEGELLNTPLRIYALVRLGITDSVKIAALLHCSTQTVYNNRLKVRNKSIIPKENFADAVRTLGKHVNI